MRHHPPAQRKMAPHLQNATFALWIFFLVWSAFALWVLPFQIGSEQAKITLGDPSKSGLAATATFLLNTFDFTWFTLAALSTYFALITTEGIRLARRGTGIALAVLTLFLLISNGSTVNGSAPLFFTGKLGFKLAGRLPLGLLFLGIALFFGARSLVLTLLPRNGAPWQRQALINAASIALLSGLAAWNIAHVAIRHRFYWLWNDNAWAIEITAIAWAGVALLLSLLIPGGSPSKRQTIIFLTFNIVFLISNIMQS